MDEVWIGSTASHVTYEPLPIRAYLWNSRYHEGQNEKLTSYLPSMDTCRWWIMLPGTVGDVRREEFSPLHEHFWSGIRGTLVDDEMKIRARTWHSESKPLPSSISISFVVSFRFLPSFETFAIIQLFQHSTIALHSFHLFVLFLT